jgi:transcriptional regulator with XRE-family HTH domain
MATAEQKAQKAFGNNVASIRSTKRMTQEQLADRANLDRMTIAFIEGGRRFPRLGTIQAIADALGVSIQDLFKGL